MSRRNARIVGSVEAAPPDLGPEIAANKLVEGKVYYYIAYPNALVRGSTYGTTVKHKYKKGQYIGPRSSMPGTAPMKALEPLFEGSNTYHIDWVPKGRYGAGIFYEVVDVDELLHAAHGAMKRRVPRETFNIVSKFVSGKTYKSKSKSKSPSRNGAGAKTRRNRKN